LVYNPIQNLPGKKVEIKPLIGGNFEAKIEKESFYQ
jgi:hypothetical protein